jgi:hypothetical protein
MTVTADQRRLPVGGAERLSFIYIRRRGGGYLFALFAAHFNCCPVYASLASRVKLGHYPMFPWIASAHARNDGDVAIKTQRALAAVASRALFSVMRGHATGCGVAPQISSAYCWIVRSLENLPEPAMLRMLFFAHSSGLR